MRVEERPFGQANVISHLDRVLELMSHGVLDPSPLVTSSGIGREHGHAGLDAYLENKTVLVAL